MGRKRGARLLRGVTISYHCHPPSASLLPSLEPAPLLLSHAPTFDALVEFAVDAIVRLDGALCCRYANTAAVRLAGPSGGLVAGQALDALTGTLSAVLRAGQSAIRQAFAEAAPQDYAYQEGAVAFEGRVIPEVQGRAVRTVLIVARDVSRVSALEAQLREHETALKAVLDTMPDAVMTGNAAGEIEGINRAAERIFGYTVEELRGKNARVLFDGPLGQRDDLLARFGTAVLRYGQRGAYEAVGRRKDGTLVPCELLLAANDVGGRRYYTGVIRDVSERKAASRALQESGDRYRAISKLIGAFGLEYRVEGSGKVHLEWVTDTVTSVLGYAVAEALSLHSTELVHPDDLAVWKGLIERVKAGKEQTAEFRVRTKRGRYVWLRLFAYPIHDDNGRLVRIHASAQDVTTQKAGEAELVAEKERAEQAARLKDAFLANMSHEIRTPLTAILGITELLRDEAPEEIREYVDLIDAGGRRLMDTLTSVLELAQLRSKTVTFVPSFVDIRAMLTETVALFKRAATEKGLEMSVEGDEPLVAILDHGALVRILTNLAGNAVKFTEQGHVRLAATREGNEIVLSVRDTGEGISEAFLSHLFEEFRQESSGMTRTHEGNGLGLAITKHLVELMGGTIAVQSEKHVGTTFVVRLPLPPVELNALR